MYRTDRDRKLPDDSPSYRRVKQVPIRKLTFVAAPHRHLKSCVSSNALQSDGPLGVIQGTTSLDRFLPTPNLRPAYIELALRCVPEGEPDLLAPVGPYPPATELPFLHIGFRQAMSSASGPSSNPSKPANTQVQLGPPPAAPTYTGTVETGSHRRGFANPASVRNSSAPRNNQGRKQQHKRHRRPRLVDEDALAESHDESKRTDLDHPSDELLPSTPPTPSSPPPPSSHAV
ncbi:hypothetical protein CIHG_04354 [Coccidioides immitis H538.4]|uniref:Uncharacterized protein n=1 Tax=Coccidioides immitis H538.4 TaxID=396776 RepID=A0A0J8RN82_COCIT|nr:hypothetical protein CIHG_04354 [Coccidioides immitis H538.4]